MNVLRAITVRVLTPASPTRAQAWFTQSRKARPMDWVSWRISQCKSATLLDTLFEQVTLAASVEEAQTHVKSALGNGT